MDDITDRPIEAQSEKKTKKEARRYEKRLVKLQVELSHLQSWVQKSGARIVIIFEGRDAAGKGASSSA